MSSPDPAFARPMPWQWEWRPLWVPGDPEPTVPARGFLGWADVAATSPAPLVGPGLLIAIDPATGRPVRPSAAQRAAAARGAEHPEGGMPDVMLPVERLPGGGEMVHLKGRFQVYSVARRDAAGRITTDCVTGSAPAIRVLAQPPAPSPRRSEER